MSEPSLPLTGGCGCGAVRYEVAEAPAGAVDCHRTRPGLRQVVADAAPWEPIPDDGLPRFDGRPG